MPMAKEAPETQYSSSNIEIMLETEKEIKGIKYLNFSGRPLEEVLHWLPPELVARRVVLFPDFAPGESQIPTGCYVELDPRVNPDWRRLVISDIGCGMQLVKSRLTWDEFDDSLDKWDKVMGRIKANKGSVGDLGSGNHFLDAMVDDHEQVYFVVHTGSRKKTKEVARVVDDLSKFESRYVEALNWARSNRDAVCQILQETYGKLEIVTDVPHNFYQEEKGLIRIYKGAVRLKPGEVTLIPSSMDGPMALVEGTIKLIETGFGMSHGTGRIKSRGESKIDSGTYDFEALRKRIYIPEGIESRSLRTENPSCYRKLDDCLKLVRELAFEKQRLHPIAYIGQL